MARLSLSLLGSMQFLLDGRPVSGFAYNKARALLAYLAVEAERPHHRDALVGLLWPELPDTAARTNLRQALANLREAIGDATATPPFLLITRDTIQFNPASDYELDVAAFTALLTTCETHTHRHQERCRSCVARMEQAIALCRGGFLAGFSVGDSAPFEEWQLLMRERLHQHALDALIRLTDYYERRGDDEPARRYAQRQVELEPWREEAHRHLMRLQARGGQRSAALAQYATCRRILARDLGVEPEAETTALYERIRDNVTGRQADKEQMQANSLPPLLLISPAPRHNFPAQTTLLIGREAELAELGALLENPVYRLITIVGPGGIGKTRLALAAAEQVEAFTHGAVFVPLQAISSTVFLAPAILAALDVPLHGQRDPREQLLDYLRGKELLLVLDNFEQLLAPELIENEGGAALLVETLQHAPGVTLLVTSRERLALHGEWLFDLSGLSYPASQTINGIDDYGAVRLFLQRAGQVRRQVALADGEARAVARICRLVEGLPLAIELAAAALRTRSCAAIADVIETSLSALATSLRAVPERHRSIWATFEHSWRLLSEAERQVLARLSVFRGGFEEQAAAQVAQATPQLLAALLDKSLLRWDGVAHYDLHELVRQYAGEKLEQAGESDHTHRQHLVYFLALAEAAEPQLYGHPETRRWLDRLEQEHDNLRAALGRAIEWREADLALRLGVALGWFWWFHDHDREGLHWLDAALTLSGADQTAVRAYALFYACVLDHYSGRGSARGEESLALFRALGDTRGAARASLWLAQTVFEHGNTAWAEALFAESAALGQELSDTASLADATYCMLMLAELRGDDDAKLPLAEKLVALRHQAGEPGMVVLALAGLGEAARLLGDDDRALAAFEEALAQTRALRGNMDLPWILTSLAFVVQRQGDRTRAVALLREALAVSSEMELQDRIPFVLTGLADVMAAQAQPERAARLLGAAEAWYEMNTMGNRPTGRADRADYERITATARAQLDEVTFASAWGTGRALTLEQAIAYALDGSVVDVEQPARAVAAAKHSG